jgi:predicted transcriptional regulator
LIAKDWLDVEIADELGLNRKTVAKTRAGETEGGVDKRVGG